MIRPALATTLLCGLAAAQFTYVDADTGSNTIELVTGTTTAWGTTVNNGGDDLWARRTTGPGFAAANGTAWQSTNAEDSPLLMTTIGGLTPNTEHSVYVFFIGKQCARWPIQAGIDPSRMRDIDDRDAVAVTSAGTATTAPSCSDFRFRAFLGHTTSDAAGQIFVFVDDYAPGDNPNPSSDRVVYDGVGAEPGLRAGVAPFGRGCAGSSGDVPRSDASGAPALGNANFALEVSGAPANGLAVALMNTTTVPILLGSCYTEMAGAASAVVPLDATGRGTLAFPIPNDPTLLGIQLYTQTATLDDGATLLGFLGLTRTLDLYVGN